VKKSLGHKASLKDHLVGQFSSGTLLFKQNIAWNLFYEVEEGEIILLAMGEKEVPLVTRKHLQFGKPSSGPALCICDYIQQKKEACLFIEH